MDASGIRIEDDVFASLLHRHAAATSGPVQVVGNPTAVASPMEATIVKTGNEGNQPV